MQKPTHTYSCLARVQKVKIGKLTRQERGRTAVRFTMENATHLQQIPLWHHQTWFVTYLIYNDMYPKTMLQVGHCQLICISACFGTQVTKTQLDVWKQWRDCQRRKLICDRWREYTLQIITPLVYETPFALRCRNGHHVLDIKTSFWSYPCFLEKRINTQSDSENKVNVSRRLIGGMWSE